MTDNIKKLTAEELAYIVLNHNFLVTANASTNNAEIVRRICDKHAGDKLTAVKIVKYVLNIGLKEAKDLMEFICPDIFPPHKAD